MTQGRNLGRPHLLPGAGFFPEFDVLETEELLPERAPKDQTRSANRATASRFLFGTVLLLQEHHVGSRGRKHVAKYG